jgi:hypothetical protein
VRRVCNWYFAELGTNTNNLNDKTPDRQARTGGLTGTALLGVVWLSGHGGCATRSVVARTNERKCRRRCGGANDDVKAAGERSVRWKVSCSKLTLVQAAGSVSRVVSLCVRYDERQLRCDTDSEEKTERDKEDSTQLLRNLNPKPSHILT